MSSSSESWGSHWRGVRVSLREVDIEPQPFNISGHFVDVFRGRHPKHGVLALKRLRTSGSEDDNIDFIMWFLREAETWQDLAHPNILPILGVDSLGDHVYLISPYAEHGTVVDYLKRNPTSNRPKFVLEIAVALAFLHSKNIVHGDLKGRDVLVSADLSVQVCDFGLARYANTTTPIGVKGAGSTRWMSPEVLEGEQKSFASDVYAFGMTVAELLSGKLPFSQYDGEGAVITAVLIRGKRPPKIPSVSADGSSYRAKWDIAEQCWDNKVNKRPSMNQVVRRLGG